MAALVQSFPQQTSMTMLRPRPTSTSPFQSGMQGQQRAQHHPRNAYAAAAAGSNTAYSMHNAVPIAPYAFTATPSLSSGNSSNNNNIVSYSHHATAAPVAPQLRSDNRSVSSSASSVATAGGQQCFVSASRQQSPSSDSAPALPNVDISAEFPKLGALDLTLSDPRLLPTNGSVKPSPDRYRRNHRRSETSSGVLSSQTMVNAPSAPATATSGRLYNHPSQSLSSPSFSTVGKPHVTSLDDTAIPRHSEHSRRYRRRSINTIGNDDQVVPQSAPSRASASSIPQTKTYASALATPYNPERAVPAAGYRVPRPELAHTRTASDDSASSKSSRPSSSKREGSGSASGFISQNGHVSRNEVKVINIPPRNNPDAKKVANPSPLSKPVDISVQEYRQPSQPRPQPAEIPAPAASQKPQSPAAQQLADLNKKEEKKGKSRLRRAFSFGSATELRKVTAENNSIANAAAGRAKLTKERPNEDEVREAAEIAQQEASGLGESIYSGQGHFFTGSTDNLSISSTASSASMMLRKMGKGVKKSTRSFVGLFRPKSIVGAPIGDPSVPEPSVAQVSMVTVEAEREKVNVNLDPHDRAGGGSAFPKLERNSIDASNMVPMDFSAPTSTLASESVKSRLSIVGGDKERAEVLAAVKKGILKRTDSASSSPNTKPTDSKPDHMLPQIPRFTDSPHSSAPSTPVDDHSPRGHRRTDSVTIEGEDYFVSVARLAASAAAEAKSLPGTPRSSGGGRNISFSPRIQFHDTWPSGEYDRRGEIATCNRLTPTLAQAIKEELNSFKMEMEVHESSKVYTHFF